MLFTREDLDEAGAITQAAVDRECRLMKVPYALTAQWVGELYLLAKAAPPSHSLEKLPVGVFAEVQLGRHIEDKLMFRFQF